jgi:TM2 domain-containing membrane protein YozV
MPGEKNAGIAAVLSFFVTGLGQIYNGQIFKGILLILIQIVNGLLLYILIGFITMPIVWLYGVINAYRHAEELIVVCTIDTSQ